MYNGEENLLTSTTSNTNTFTSPKRSAKVPNNIAPVEIPLGDSFSKLAFYNNQELVENPENQNIIEDSVVLHVD